MKLAGHFPPYAAETKKCEASPSLELAEKFRLGKFTAIFYA